MDVDGVKVKDANEIENEIIKEIEQKEQEEIKEIEEEIEKLEKSKEKDSKKKKKIEKLKEKRKRTQLSKENQEEETEKEKLIRTGMMTPFNTIIETKERVKKKQKNTENTDLDDGNEDLYLKRIKEIEKTQEEEIVFNDSEYSIPESIYDQLFDYQKVAVRWLWELHQQKVGGILGDEMGLGKTIEICAFLRGMYHSKLLKPSIIVCPGTVMTQWVKELHEWCPHLRICLFHGIGTSEKSDEELLEDVSKSENGILITTYDGVRINQDVLLAKEWQYIILDEGHKIRNPDAEITLCLKKFETYHRIILTGTPIQNNLKELWSLFDFVFPGKLGTLPIFQNQFGIPITQGGYSSAKTFHVQTAYKCSVILRNLISPYLLRRMKKDVEHHLPKKTEQVLFCKLTEKQLKLYKNYLNSKDIKYVKENHDDNEKGVLFKAISHLRKICNHPSLVEDSETIEIDHSAKLVIVNKLLPLWKEEKHKILLYSQSTKMLDILENVIKEKYSYLRMDGKTDLSKRSQLIDKFNKDESVFIFLLTTKVGGVGINLIGADRILIYDPDWNPSTDMQALERCWRLGQTKDVTVYRLMTSGTIEEKMYHRQIFKQFLTNKILKDPRQRKFFKENDLYDLFQLGPEYLKENQSIETSKIFEESEIKEHEMNNEDKNNETYILKSLFDGNDVLSAFNHDDIMSGSSDIKIIQEEAQKIAKKSEEMLKESRERCFETPIGTPTWTGHHGSAGKKFGQKVLGDSNQSSKNIISQNQNIVKEEQDLLLELQNFLKDNNGEALSNEIVTHFKEKVKGKMVVMFKPMLKQIATLNDGKWKLKKEFL